jgi:CelD/BcsL family acetyltransferase involved in cellulose biosynthesis
MEEVMKTAIEDGLNIDFGFGDNEYKKDFCNHETIVYSADLLLGGISLAIPAYRALLKYRGKLPT